MELKDAIIVVTGGAGGIGEALVAAFVRQAAAAVIVHDRDQAAADAVAARHQTAQTVVVAQSGDLCTQLAVDELVMFVEERFGRIDLFCSNAGILLEGGVELPTEQWNQAWSINVMAHVHAARAALPGMRRRRAGHFLNVCSAAGMLTAPGAASYAATKHAALGFAEWLAITYGDKGIGVHVVCPEAIDTRMLSDSLASRNDGIRRVAERSLVLGTDAVTEAVVAGLKEDRFLITTHPDTLKNTQRKWADPDRWLAAMRSFLGQRR
jgi:NAD(P)-dependent dehydrogenase (short-subunit alcohol dehydrogenase family)